MASADRFGVELVAVNVAQQIASVSVADREHAMGRDSWEGSVHAYTDGGLDPGVSPRAGFGVVLLPPRVNHGWLGHSHVMAANKVPLSMVDIPGCGAD